MRADADQFPRIGQSGALLGVRVAEPADVEIVDGVVKPRSGGMSVAAENPRHLPDHRRPKTLGGTGTYPVFSIQEEHLGEELEAYLDDLNGTDPYHFVIAPRQSCPFLAYERAIHATRERWTHVHID
ncbi:hypothetical protein [Rudaea sp. 3F27F6]|nr:hypothetical protein [Rudaea sp. 3F27F6]